MSGKQDKKLRRIAKQQALALFSAALKEIHKRPFGERFWFAARILFPSKSERRTLKYEPRV
jgi:hypothetical protein